MKLMKLSLAAALAATMGMASDITSEIGVSANVSMTSNYMWRGMSQTSNSPAIQGGFDLDYKGFYVGTWGSNVAGETPENSLTNYGEANMELDLYAGYSSEFAGIGYDIGFLQFVYPGNTKESGWGEAYLGLSYDLEVVSVGAKYSYAIDTMDNGWDDQYNLLELSASVPLPYDMAIDGTYGFYENVGDYYYVGLTKSIKSYDFTLAYTGLTDSSVGSVEVSKEDKATFTVGTSF
ncbi:TorF family putative porin [Sulfurimonas microaerophilic]|uniref:TorF family putative porin n=1 Tax=Sulfurimonas microaerophilic TaxID=3058392 RepID=UPI00271492DC|nr:TorF family putative porin [Sulfurimonas sp. hsl 1-7]